MGHSVDKTDWPRVSRLVADTIGLHFSPERLTDLQRGVAGITAELQFNDVAACADWLLTASLNREHLQLLSGHLTIGETYFFREKQTFEAIARDVLPSLIGARRGCDQQLRIWSAGCCTGEEAYSIAILLHQTLPDLASWRVKILATDINARFILKANAATYGEWSFRGAPKGLVERYFTRSRAGQYTVVPEIKSMVSFAHLNLAEDTYPSPANDTHAMDIIFCRNVLMYFTQAQAAKVVGKFHSSLLDGGYMAVSPSEASQALFSEFVSRNAPGTTLYQKVNIKDRERKALYVHTAQTTEQSRSPGLVAVAQISTSEVPSEKREKSGKASVRDNRRKEPIVEVDSLKPAAEAETAILSQMARSLADQGLHLQAIEWCNKWIAADKLDSAAHYLHATVLLEQADKTQARHSLSRTIYIDPNFVLAHFVLGNLARANGEFEEAQKHFGNVRRLLSRYNPDEPLPESGGLTASRLIELMTNPTTQVSER